MPILEVRAVPPEQPDEIPEALSALCAAVAGALGCEERAVWATWQSIPAGHYVEGGVPAVRQPFDTHPPLVRVLLFEGRPPATIRALLEAAAAALAAALGIEPGNVFVHVEEMGAGTVHSGGNILE